MQLLAESLNAEGYGIEVPLLEGHGTTLNDLMGVHLLQWIDPLDALITRLLSEGQSVVLGGLSLAEIHAAFWPLCSSASRNLCQSRPLISLIQARLSGFGLTTVTPLRPVLVCSISSLARVSSSPRFSNRCWPLRVVTTR